jgi:hypothetical protein
MASPRSSSFSKWKKAYWRMLLYLQARIPRICNRCYWATFTKGGFLTFFRSFAIFYNWSRFDVIVIFMWATTFYSFRRTIAIGVTKNLYIHGNMVLLFRTFKAHPRAINLCLFLLQNCAFSSIAQFKAILHYIFSHYFWPCNTTWSHPSHIQHLSVLWAKGEGAHHLCQELWHPGKYHFS